jgi:hypothetical protein
LEGVYVRLRHHFGFLIVIEHTGYNTREETQQNQKAATTQPEGNNNQGTDDDPSVSTEG